MWSQVGTRLFYHLLSFKHEEGLRCEDAFLAYIHFMFILISPSKFLFSETVICHFCRDLGFWVLILPKINFSSDYLQFYFNNEAILQLFKESQGYDHSILPFFPSLNSLSRLSMSQAMTVRGGGSEKKVKSKNVISLEQGLRFQPKPKRFASFIPVSKGTSTKLAGNYRFRLILLLTHKNEGSELTGRKIKQKKKNLRN